MNSDNGIEPSRDSIRLQRLGQASITLSLLEQRQKIYDYELSQRESKIPSVFRDVVIMSFLPSITFEEIHRTNGTWFTF